MLFPFDLISFTKSFKEQPDCFTGTGGESIYGGKFAGNFTFYKNRILFILHLRRKEAKRLTHTSLFFDINHLTLPLTTPALQMKISN